MINYLEVIAKKCAIEGRYTGSALDVGGRYFPTDGVLVARCPRSLLPWISQAITERIPIAKGLLSGDKPLYPITYGLCDTCGQPQEPHRAGRCPLCSAAYQKAKSSS